MHSTAFSPSMIKITHISCAACRTITEYSEFFYTIYNIRVSTLKEQRLSNSIKQSDLQITWKGRQGMPVTARENHLLPLPKDNSIFITEQIWCSTYPINILIWSALVPQIIYYWLHNDLKGFILERYWIQILSWGQNSLDKVSHQQSSASSNEFFHIGDRFLSC
jgi:hypothetical protein